MDKHNEERPFKEVLKELAESSTVHGVPKIVSSRQLAVKVLWCILMIVGFCVLTVQLVALFRTFTSHPVQTTVSLDFATLRFPAISLCNMNPVRKSKIGMSAQLKNTMFPQKKKYFSAMPEKTLDPAPEKEVKEASLRMKRQSASSNETLSEVDDISLSLFVGGNETHVDLSSTGENETASGALNDSVTESPYKSSSYPSYPSFSYDYDSHYVWDIFEYLDVDETFNISSLNLSLEYDYESKAALTEHYQNPKDKWEQVIAKFKTAFRKVTVEKRKRMGHQLIDFIQHASFAKREQNITKYYKQFTSSDYGNCYTMDHPKYRAWGSGPDGGIKMTLYLEVDEYIENYSSGFGVRIVFHEPGTFPMPAEEGLTLSPGYETSIGLRAINITRLGRPYGNCTSNGNTEFLRKYNLTYSKTACLAFCRVENVIDECWCIPSDAPDITFKTKRPICGSNPWDEFCVDIVNRMFEEGSLGCDCISPCSEFVYTKTMSGRVWPHKDYLEKVLMKDICAKNLSSLRDACHQIENDTVDFNYERYRHNFVRVLIYFEDLNYEKITEEPFYTPVRFVSDIGGAAGLFMGISLLSFFELFQLILEIVLHLFPRKMKSQTNDESKEQKKEVLM